VLGALPIGQTPLKLGGLFGAALEKALAAVAAQQPVQEAPVSLLGDLARTAGGALGSVIGSVLPGVGAQTGAALGSAIQNTLNARVAAPVGMVSNILPALPAAAGVIGGAVVTGGRVLMAGARSVASSAVTYCRRHPQWCASIGGTAAIGALIQGGQLPPIKRRRARGISPSEFRGFRKVHKVLSGFCAPRMRVKRGAAKCR
jgi:hypothetical protein